jgi:hypothetical protein
LYEGKYRLYFGNEQDVSDESPRIPLANPISVARYSGIVPCHDEEVKNGRFQFAAALQPDGNHKSPP